MLYRKQSDLKALLKELSESQEIINDYSIVDYVVKLKRIYDTESGFRHLYSEIFSTVADICITDDEKLEFLANNLRYIYEYVMENEKRDEKFQRNILKLYDHVNLDVARLNFWRRSENKIKEENEKLQRSIQIARDELKGVQKKSANMQKDYVAILGIFSAVLLTFIGNIAFSTSVLSNIHQSSMYRISFITVFLGFVVFNLLVYLMNFIKAVMDVKISLVTDFVEHREKVNKFFVVLLLLLIIAWFLDLNVIKRWIHNFNFENLINYYKNNTHT